MKAILSFFIGISLLVLVICLAGWLFISDFFIFDVLLIIGMLALQLVIPILVLIAILWVLNEIFR